MPDQKIVEYINSQLAAGFDRNKIHNDLLNNGFLPSEIDLAFNSLNLPVQGVPAPASPAYNPGSTVPNQVPASGGSVFKKILVTVVVLVVIGAVSVAAYFGVNYFKGNQVTLSGAIINTIDALSTNKIKSGEFSVVADFTAKDVGKNYSSLATDPTSQQITSQLQDVAFNLTYSGVVNKTTDGKFETSGDLSASVKNPNGGSLGMFASQEIGFQYKTFSDFAYINVQNIPSLALAMISQNIDTAKYLNQWFSIPTAETNQLSQTYTNSISTTTLSAGNKSKMVDLFDNSGAFSIVDRKPETTSKGTAVTALYIKIDWDKFADEVVKLNQQENQAKGTVYSKSSELEFRANVQKAKELPISNSIFKILVGSDGYIHGYFASGDLLDKSNTKIGSYNISLSADNYNQNFIIDRPTGARDFNEVMKEINGLMIPVKTSDISAPVKIK